MVSNGSSSEGRIKVLYVEPVGGHRGMHYYDFALCGGLVEHGVQPILVTCDETVPEVGLPFEMERAFVGIFGSGPAWRRGLNYAWGLGRVLRCTPRRDGRIVHLHYSLVPVLDLIFVCALRQKGFRVVLTVHDVVPFDAGPLDLSALRWIYRLVNRIIVHTVPSKKELISLTNSPQDKVSVIHQGPYTGFASAAPLRSPQEARALLDLPIGGQVILFFGQIKRVKGLDTLIRSFSQIQDTRPNVRLVVAGPVWKEDLTFYTELIETLRLSERVVMRTEYIPDEEVSLYFQAADVIALPYRKVYQSAVLFMAHSFARPIVATDVGGLAEVIRDGQTGYLVPPDDEHALAAALCAILADGSGAERMGLRGRHWVEQHYSWSAIAGQTAQLYRDLLSATDAQGSDSGGV